MVLVQFRLVIIARSVDNIKHPAQWLHRAARTGDPS